jgi:hypothetical protein
MKFHRIIAVTLAFAFLFSTFGAAPVYAEPIDKAKSACAVSSATASEPFSFVNFDLGKKEKMGKISITNKTGGYMSFTFRNSKGGVFYFGVAPGKQTISLPKDKYSYTASSICGSKSGNITVKGKRAWKWWCKKAKK